MYIMYTAVLLRSAPSPSFRAQVWGAPVYVIIAFLLFYLIQYDNSLIDVIICKSEINNYLPPLTNKTRRKNEKYGQIKMDLVRFWARRKYKHTTCFPACIYGESIRLDTGWSWVRVPVEPCECFAFHYKDNSSLLGKYFGEVLWRVFFAVDPPVTSKIQKQPPALRHCDSLQGWATRTLAILCGIYNLCYISYKTQILIRDMTLLGKISSAGGVSSASSSQAWYLYI